MNKQNVGVSFDWWSGFFGTGAGAAETAAAASGGLAPISRGVEIANRILSFAVPFAAGLVVYHYGKKLLR